MAADWDEMASVGVVARTHGNRGEVILNSATDFAEARFRVGAELYVCPAGRVQTLRVSSLRFHQGRPVIGVEGVGSIGEAEPLASLELRVPMASLQKLPQGSYYEHDLVGCRVATTADHEVGTVRDLGGAAGNRWLVIEGASGEVLVPFAAAICVVIDVVGRRIVIDPPEGLLHANTRV